jgi:hypothetical protein
MERKRHQLGTEQVKIPPKETEQELQFPDAKA